MWSLGPCRRGGKLQSGGAEGRGGAAAGFREDAAAAVEGGVRWPHMAPPGIGDCGDDGKIAFSPSGQ